MRDVHPAVWFVPATMLAIAVFPLPYGYFKLMRLVVCGCAAFLAFKLSEQDQKLSLSFAMLVALALLFNPLVPVHLTKEIWRVLDLSAAALFVFNWHMVKGKA